MRHAVDGLRQDLKFTFRSFLRRPGLFLVAVATLGIGIGATTAIYSVVDAVLLESPPYDDADRLVAVWHRMSTMDGSRRRVAGPDVARYRAEAGSLDGVAFVSGADDRALDGVGADEHLRVGVATADLFALLGLETIHGRLFLPGEGVTVGGVQTAGDPSDAPAPLVLGFSAWQGRFGADPGVVGRVVRLSGRSMQIVGVLREGAEVLLPPGSGLPTDIDAWTPLSAPLEAFRRPEGLRDQDSDNSGFVIGRLAAGATLAGARQELDVIAARQRADIPFYREAGLSIEVEKLRETLVGDARPIVVALMGAVVFVLLIACINVANLLLARAMDRQGEMAVRSAMGAGRRRLIRQSLTESVVLAGGGLVVGALLAAWGIDLLMAVAPDALPRGFGVTIDRGVLLAAAVTGTVAALLFGMAPSILVARQDNAALRTAGARGGGGKKLRLRRSLVVSEVAICFALLVGAGLMVRSARNLARVDPGFDARGLHTFTVSLPGGTVGGPADRARYMDALERGVRDLPGVEAVGLIGGLPLGGVVWRQPYGAEGTSVEEWSRNDANFRVITADYFRAMNTRLLAGRHFTAAENLNEDERVVIVDPSLAARLAPDGNAVGMRVGFPLDGDPVWATIVGVVEDVRFSDLRRPGGTTIYVPYRQEASRTVSIAVRTTGGAIGLPDRIREVVAGLESDVAIPAYNFRDMESYVDRALAPTRFALGLVALFSVVALVLSAVGLSGLISYVVSARTREFGIRVALGADRRRVQRSVMGGAASLALFGIVVGTVLAFISSSALGALVFDVARADVLTYAVVAVTLFAVAGVASWVPARRAASVEPLTALGMD